MPEINFFWDPLSDNILQERDETGAVTAEYTAEPGLYGNVISQNRGGVESQFHYDAQGSTLAVTDDDQNVTDTFAYTAFGEVTERTGATQVPFQYIGQKGYYTDGLTGQIMARERPYEPVRSRWMASDRLGDTRGRSPYVYVGNRPLVLVDPSGLQAAAQKKPIYVLQLACCSYCRFCGNSAIVRGVSWCFGYEGRQNKECEDEKTVLCAAEYDPDTNQIYRTPKTCCEKHTPFYWDPYCTYYDVETWASNSCGGFWNSQCDRDLITWITKAKAQDAEGRVACYIWCKNCVSDDPLTIGVCKLNICDEIYGGTTIDVDIELDVD